MRIQLSDHFNYGRLVRFTFPTITMMLFVSIYGAVDGIFVSNFAGKTQFAAMNLIYPLWIICASLGYVFETGGTAYVSKTLGEGNKEKAVQLFSLFVYAGIAIGVIVGILGSLAAIPAAKFLGAEGELLTYSTQYIWILLLFLPFAVLQMEFHSFCVTAEKPKLGLIVTLCSGMSNIILDALFVWYFKWGAAGAAFATGLSIVVGGGVPLLYFSFPNNSLLRLTRCKFDRKALCRAFINGISEFVNNVSWAVVVLLYVGQLMHHIGEEGVAVLGVVTYLYSLFQSVFSGYSVGIASVLGFNFGARNADELKNILCKSLFLILVTSFTLFSLGEVYADKIAGLFAGYDPYLLELTIYAIKIVIIAFLFTGFNKFGSAFFTALSDGVTSAKIVSLRSILLEPVTVVLLPYLYGIESIWWSLVVVEVFCIIVTTFYFIKKRNLYLHPAPNY